MNREIKFRGFDKQGICHFGFLTISEPNKIHTINYQSKYGYWQYDHVLPDTVGQFTGLKDNKGTDIYEGDIVQILDNLGDSYNYLIQYNLDIFCLAGKEFGSDEWLRLEDLVDCELIGNIHQNSDSFI